MSSYFLGESLNLLGKLGCAICVAGSTVMVIHAPEEGKVTTVVEMAAKMKDTGRHQAWLAGERRALPHVGGPTGLGASQVEKARPHTGFPAWDILCHLAC